MQRVPDPYRELGVVRGATDAQIKAAHRRLAKRYHPDAPEGDTVRFLAVQEAYLLLSDPLQRREWDARHSPSPMRAGEAGERSRARGTGGRWTREEPEPAPRRGAGGGAGPGAAGSGGAGRADGRRDGGAAETGGTGGAAGTGTGRGPAGAGRAAGTGGTSGVRGGAEAGSAGAGAGGAAGARGPGRRRAATRRGGSAGAFPESDGEEAARPAGPWSASGRDAASRSYTWSAQGVPWWEDFAPRDRSERGAGTSSTTPSSAGAGTASADQGASGASPSAQNGRSAGRGARGSGSDREESDQGHDSSGSGQPSSTQAGADTGRRAGSGGSGSRSDGSRRSRGDATSGDPSRPGASGNEFDVYSRSSGAAWSFAARRYFRKADADLPSRGTFVYRGTQVVTGAQAREVAAEKARRQAADDLLRPRPGSTGGGRQAFDHPPQAAGAAQAVPGAKAVPRSGAQAAGAAQPTAQGDDRSHDAAPSEGNAAESPYAQPSAAAEAAARAQARAEAEAEVRAPVARTGEPLGIVALVGGAAALVVTLPVVLLAGVLLTPPLQPLFGAVLLALAAATGALAATAWERVRRPPAP